MNESVRIKVERTGDEPAIHALHVACFPTDAEARLVDALRSAGRLTVSLVAERDDKVVGHLAFSPVTVANGQTGLGLAPVAVLPECRRQGIAAELICTGLQACRCKNSGWVVVLGEPDYYAQFGFRPAPDYGLHDAYGGGAAFQALELETGALPVDAGLVSYAPEFELFA